MCGCGGMQIGRYSAHMEVQVLECVGVQEHGQLWDCADEVCGRVQMLRGTVVWGFEAGLCRYMKQALSLLHN